MMTKAQMLLKFVLCKNKLELKIILVQFLQLLVFFSFIKFKIDVFFLFILHF